MEFIVEKSGERLDKFLTSHLKRFSRSRFQKFIKSGSVKVDGKVILKPSLELKIGGKVEVSDEDILAAEKEFMIEPESGIPLDVVYEDKDIVVINKQAGLIVHPTLSKKKHTLANALVERYPEIIGVGESPFRPGIVHRIDKDTSGLVIIAKNQEAFMFIKKQFLNHTVKKTYSALVEGVPKAEEGIINFQIRPSKENRFKKVAITKPGTVFKTRSVRNAETSYKVKERFWGFSLIDAFPKTGRTHQIRVHFAAIGCPIAGDEMYGAKSKIAKRQMLHARAIEFIAPSGKKLSLEIDLPDDMKKIIGKLRKVKK
mgnify:CR=1 FL=1